MGVVNNLKIMRYLVDSGLVWIVPDWALIDKLNKFERETLQMCGRTANSEILNMKSQLLVELEKKISKYIYRKKIYPTIVM